MTKSRTQDTVTAWARSPGRLIQNSSPTENLWTTRMRRPWRDRSRTETGQRLPRWPKWASDRNRARGRPSHALVAIGLSAALKRAGMPALQDALMTEAAGLTRQLGGEPFRA